MLFLSCVDLFSSRVIYLESERLVTFTMYLLAMIDKLTNAVRAIPR